MKRRPTHPLSHLTRREFVQGSVAGLAVMGLARCGASDVPPPVCEASTAPNVEGPFFAPDSPERANLMEPGMSGTALRITGRVFDLACVPVVGATLDFWQADEGGDYDNVGSTLRGHQFTDLGGRYQLDTVLPGRYPIQGSLRPRHIHVTVSAPGALPLTTQLYFEGDPYIEGDAFVVDSLIMSLRDGADDRTDASFDFVVGLG